MEKSMQEVVLFAGIIGVNLKQSEFGRQMKTWRAKSGAAEGAEEEKRIAAEGAETVLSDVVPAGAPGSPIIAGEEIEEGEDCLLYTSRCV